MWECGLKLTRDEKIVHLKKVTPYVGVWIETQGGVKFVGDNGVTPYVGVWIETTMTEGALTLTTVTPYVGVWIETCGHRCGGCSGWSLLMWECGLKRK